MNDIAEEIGQLTQLRELYLWGNNLDSLPQAITRLQNLETINISKNNFTEIPPELFTLSSLKTICLMDLKEGVQLEYSQPQVWQKIQSGSLSIIGVSFY